MLIVAAVAIAARSYDPARTPSSRLGNFRKQVRGTPVSLDNFTLSLRGYNLDAHIWTVSARFDGVWGEGVDDIHSHLVVEPPSRVR